MDRLAALNELLKETPGDPFLLYGIALEYAKAGKRAEAISRVEKLLEDNPGYLGAYYLLGQWLEQENELEKAMDVYRRGMKVAQEQKNMKTLGELRSALEMIED